MLTASLLALVLVRPANSDWGPPPPVAPYMTTALPTSRAIRSMIFPVLGRVRMTSGFNDHRGTHRHTGMDIVAPKMAPIVAPFSGTLGMKTNSFWIWADDGWAVLGTHLNDDTPGTRDNRAHRDFMFAPDLTPGMRVEAGRLIGYVGDSGGASGPHLHFELYMPGARSGKTRGRLRDPAPSLHMAQRLSVPRAVLAAPDLRPTRGETRFHGCVRKVVPGAENRPGALTLLLTAKQSSSGAATALARPRYLRVRVPNAVAEEAGGWGALGRFPQTLPISVDLDGAVTADDALARRIITAPYRLR